VDEGLRCLVVRGEADFFSICFAADDEKEGKRLNDFIENVPAEIIEGFAERYEWKQERERVTRLDLLN